MTNKKRGFAVSPGMASVVAGAKVGTAGDPPVVPQQGGGETPTTPPAAPAAPEAGNTGAGAAPEPAKPAEPPAEAPKPAAEPAPAAPAPKLKPWENPTDAPKGLNFQPDASLHAKMNWVCDNVPKMSRLRILREGAMMLCDALIAKHYKEDQE